MAASSPAPMINTSDSSLTPAAVSSGSQPKTVRHVNRPKCTQCGNLARSRCPYQSCKSCCSKAKNPCHIHVLKANATTPYKAPSATMISFDQPSAESSPAMSSLRAASFVQKLSNSFTLLNNAQTPHLRKTPMTKESVAIKITLEKQNEAYNRYVQNIRLLEEALSLRLMQGSSSQDVTITDSDNAAAKKRKQLIVVEWLKKLEEWELTRRPEKKTKTWSNPRASTSKNEADSRKGMDDYSSKLVRTVEVSDQGIFSRVDAHFASLAKIARK